MNKKMRIGVIMGGLSTEREVSLKTGKTMVDTLKENKEYEVVEIIINEKEDVKKIADIDFALLAIHGKMGEYGRIQNYCELMNIQYSGCNSLTTSICMDKKITKTILKENNIPTAEWTTIKREISEEQLNKAYKLKFPVFVMPNGGGSRVRTILVQEKDEFLFAVKGVFKDYTEATEVIIEEFIKGEEIACSMLDGKLMPIIKIDEIGKFLDYESNYTDENEVEYIVSFDKKMHKNIEKACIDTWNSMGCSVYTRIDFLISGEDYKVLEVNTLPGMMPTSLFTKSAEAAGINMNDLLSRIIKLSMNR